MVVMVVEEKKVEQFGVSKRKGNQQSHMMFSDFELTRFFFVFKHTIFTT